MEDLQTDNSTAAGGVGGALTFVPYVGCVVAALACLWAGLIITGYRLMDTLRAYIRMNFLMMLGSAEIIFISFIEYTQVPQVCSVMAAGVHFSVLGAFAWLLCYVLYLGDEVKGHDGVYAFGVGQYTALGWFLPVVLVTIALVAHYQDYRSQHYCWINEDIFTMQLLWIVPIVVLATGTLLLLVYVCIKYIQVTKDDPKRKSQLVVAASGLRSCIFLLPTLTATWIIAAAALQTHLMLLQILFTVSNSILGVMVFLFMFLFNEQVIQARRGRDRGGAQRVKHRFEGETKALLEEGAGGQAALPITAMAGTAGANYEMTYKYESEAEEMGSRRSLDGHQNDPPRRLSTTREHATSELEASPGTITAPAHPGNKQASPQRKHSEDYTSS